MVKAKRVPRRDLEGGLGFHSWGLMGIHGGFSRPFLHVRLSDEGLGRFCCRLLLGSENGLVEFYEQGLGVWYSLVISELQRYISH